MIENENSVESFAYGFDIRSIRNLGIVALLVVAVIAVSRTSAPTTAILSGLLSNVPSSFVALVLGIPAGLFVARLSEEYRTRSTRLDAEVRVASQRLTILRLLQGELQDAQRYLDARVAEVGVGGAGARNLGMPAVSVALWTSISQSGDLHLVEDPQLLAKIARAYQNIADVRDRESVYYTFLRTIGMSFQRSQPTQPWPHQLDLATLDPLALAATKDAVTALETALRP